MSINRFGLKSEFRWLGGVVVVSASCGLLWVILRIFAPDWQNSGSGRIMQNRVDWALAGSWYPLLPFFAPLLASTMFTHQSMNN
jgi:hypothetical protein